MRIVAVDTSTASGSVALLKDGQVVAEWTLVAATTHNRRLLKTLDLLLNEAGWSREEVDGYAVTSGPGSFTGVRIGLTTVKSLAWAGAKSFMAISTLDVLAAPLGFAKIPVCAMLDARKKEVYAGRYLPDGRGACRLLGQYRVAAPELVAQEIKEPTLLCGDGWLLYRDRLAVDLKDLAIEVPGLYHTIRAAVLGALAYERFLAGETMDPVTAVPCYVRPSEAELNYPHRSASRPI